MAPPVATAPPRAGAKGRRPSLRVVVAVLMVAGGISLAAQGLYIHAKAIVAQVLLEKAFARSVTSGSPVKPWSWADSWPVARIVIPRLGAQTIALAGVSGQALAFGPGHVEGTPSAGEQGTAVYAGHRDTHFAFLGRMRVGDAILVTTRDGRTSRFRVRDASVVRWDQTAIDATAPGHHLVLATCWPLDGRLEGPMRYVVHADLVPMAGDLPAAPMYRAGARPSG